MVLSVWNERYAGEEYHFGTEPNAFLVSQRARLTPGLTCLAVADGEGRNGVWLAEQGLQVLSVDSSPVAQAKAKKLAQQRGVSMQFEQVDLMQWDWDADKFDVVAAIFIQFADPALRERLFARIVESLKPGGVLVLQGYTPKQLEYRTGGPPYVSHLYTPELLRAAFAALEIVELEQYEDVLSEGTGHSGRSALIGMVARRR
jgi:2-polyprenyl-3-methyl-5-hydroxy-6-metoxy-1,4-benzoquinol methylase